MEKESRVKFITPFAPKPDAKDFTFSLEFENGDKGFYHHPTATQDYFILGSLVKYELEEREKKDKSGKYFVIYQPGQKPQPKQGNGFGGGKSFSPKSAKQIKMESRTMTLRYACDLAINKVVEMKDLEPTFKRLNSMLDASLDGLEPSPAAAI